MESVARRMPPRTRMKLVRPRGSARNRTSAPAAVWKLTSKVKPEALGAIDQIMQVLGPTRRGTRARKRQRATAATSARWAKPAWRCST